MSGHRAAFSLLFMVASRLYAQSSEVTPFALESRVRVTGAAEGHSRIEGTLTALSADSIVLRERDGAKLAVALADISRLDYVASSRSRANAFS